MPLSRLFLAPGADFSPGGTPFEDLFRNRLGPQRKVETVGFRLRFRYGLAVCPQVFNVQDDGVPKQLARLLDGSAGYPEAGKVRRICAPACGVFSYTVANRIYFKPAGFKNVVRNTAAMSYARLCATVTVPGVLG